MKKILISLLAALPWLAEAGIVFHPEVVSPSRVRLTTTNDQLYLNGQVLDVAALQDQIASNTAALGALPDAQTNALLNSGKFLAYTTNSVTLSIDVGYRWVFPATFTNFNSLAYDSVGVFQVNWSTNGGTNWSTGTPGPRLGNLMLSFLVVQTPSFSVPVTPVITNIEVYCMTRPDLFGITNTLYGQSTRVAAPVNDSDAATKWYVDAQVAAVNFMAEGGVYLVGSPLNLSEQWVLRAGSNSVALKYLGMDVVSVVNPTLNYATCTSIMLSNTTVCVEVWTNGVTSAPAPQWSHDLGHVAWSSIPTFTSTYPAAVGTNYVLSFEMPHPDRAFIAVGFGSATPTVATLAGVLATSPRTITNSTQTTWGSGSGLICWDSNYVYISVGTNLWKRAVLSTW